MNFNTLSLFFAILATVALGQGWSAYTDIRTGRQSLLSNAFFSASNSLPISYNISYSSAISATLSSGLGVVGFNTYLTNYFSVNVTMNNFTTTHLGISAVPLDDTVVIDLSVHYIVVGTLTYFLDVQVSCFLPSVISVGNGTRTQSLTGTTLFVNKAVQCNVYLTGFRVYNSLGLLNYLGAQVACPSTNSYLTYTFTATENNTVSLICYTTIVFCESVTQIQYYDWGQIGNNWVTQTILPDTITVNSRYQSTDKQFWGISIFNVSRGNNRQFNFQSDYYEDSSKNIDMNYQTNSGTYAVYLSHFFIATRGCNSTVPWFQMYNGALTCVTNCDSHTQYTLNGSAKYCKTCHYTCLECKLGALQQNCTKCNNTLYRYEDTTAHTCPCQPGYIDVGAQLCALCSNYITGCHTCVTTTICSVCLPGFYIYTGTCVCSTGFLVTGICTTIYGCISATNLGGTVYCLSCNTTAYYTLAANHTCVCLSGYYLNSVQNCISSCGDSILASGQLCDDGNTISGDGCSNTCQIQSNYTCVNTPMPSKCVLNYNVTGTVAYVLRDLDSNTATFAISLSPQNEHYKSLDYLFNYKTDLPCGSGSSVYYDGTYLMLTCPYTQSIEGNSYSLSVQLDTSYWANNSYILVTLPAKGQNAKLTYDNNYKMSKTQRIFVIIISVLTILILFISSITERMIGVQCIQTFQTVLYAMTMMAVCPASIAPLQNLRYVNGYNYLFGIDYARLYKLEFAIGEVGLQHQFLVSFNLSYIILITVILLLIALKLIMIKFEKDKMKEEQEYNRAFYIEDIHPSYKNIKKVYKFIFERIFFLVAFWCMFLVIFAAANEYILNEVSTDITGIGQNGFFCTVALVIILGFLAMILVNGIYPKIRIFPMFMDARYPIYYTLYQLLYISIIVSYHNANAFPFVLAALTTINLIVLAIWRPYPQHLHNGTIVFEQATILIAIGIYLYQSYTAPLQNNQSIFSIGFFVIFFLLVIVDFLSCVRLYYFYKYMKKNNLSYDEPGTVKKDQQRALVTHRAKQDELDDYDDNDLKNKPKNTSKALDGNETIKSYQDKYFEDIKQSKKNPLNTSKDYNNNQQTKRQLKNTNNRNKKPKKQEDNYDTFSKNKGNSYQIDPIDPQPQEYRPSIANSPYDDYGNIKVHNRVHNEQEYDALKAIKARLRKDFYQKVHGADYVPPQQNMESSIGPENKHETFQPSDAHE